MSSGARRFVLSLFVLAALPVGEGATAPKADKLDIDMSRAAVHRGAEVFLTTCSFCHALKYVRYRDLMAIDYSAEQVDAIRLTAAPEDQMTNSLPTEAAMAMFGQVPPDLSLITKAREDGPGYVYSLLTGYYRDDQGRVENRLLPGIKMQDVLGAASAQTPEQMAGVRDRARDVAAFLAWAADPRAAGRRVLGYYVLAYLAVFTALLYALKRRIWSRLERPGDELPVPAGEQPQAGQAADQQP